LEKVDGGLVCGIGGELGGDEEGDRIGWFGDLTGQDAVVWEGKSRARGREEGGVAAVFIGHPGW
jgi:hypothetical protein